MNNKKSLYFIAMLFLANNAIADTAIFAMGNFWSGESFFRSSENNSKFPGIDSITSGFAGGTRPDPTMDDHEGYRLAVKVEYTPAIISYDEVLELFWHAIDPFDSTGQFCDKGRDYTSAIYYFTPEQQEVAIESKKQLEQRLNKTIVTPIIPASTFYPADEDNQDYKTKHPIKYSIHRWRCGREDKLKTIWGTHTYENNNHLDY